ncbi:MAG: hypothetical protein IPL61_17955 [Myxococcales bacterium]|nr:hypothetical protein [Myxococcales bacterium]
MVFAENRSANVTPGVIAPKFGEGCVCCGAVTSRTQLYDPSTDRIRCEAIPVPVCGDCPRHAMITPTGIILPASALLLGAIVGGLGIHRTGARPHDAAVMIAIGATVVVAGLAWIAVATVRTRRWRRAGHHPALTMSVDNGRCVLSTTNVALVNELIANNRFARRRPGRGGRGQVPEARVVSSAVAPDLDALTPEEKARLLAETLGQRPPGASDRQRPR